MSQTILTLEEIENITLDALLKAGTRNDNAIPLAKAVAASEGDGIPSHGLMYVPNYCLHVRCGKVDGDATPERTQIGASTIRVDAKTGFAHPAINLGFQLLPQLAKENGIAILTIKNSYNCGVLGYHTERLSRNNLLVLGFTNAPASIAPFGGTKPFIGTNPFSIAVPSAEQTSMDTQSDCALLIDQSASVVAKSEVIKLNNAGKEIPEGWVLDQNGKPTTSGEAGLKGSMVPSGGYKGVGMGILVEVFAAAITGAHLGIHAAPFGGDQGGPPKTGQCFIAINHEMTSGGTFHQQIAALIHAITAQEGTHLAGTERFDARKKARNEGVFVDSNLLEKIKAL